MLQGDHQEKDNSERGENILHIFIRYDIRYDIRIIYQEYIKNLTSQWQKDKFKNVLRI